MTTGTVKKCQRDAPFKVVEIPNFVKELKNVEIAIEE